MIMIVIISYHVLPCHIIYFEYDIHEFSHSLSSFLLTRSFSAAVFTRSFASDAFSRMLCYRMHMMMCCVWQDRLLLSYAERVGKNLDVKAVRSDGGDKNELIFDLVGVDASIANALRRILLAEVILVHIKTAVVGEKTNVFDSYGNVFFFFSSILLRVMCTPLGVS